MQITDKLLKPLTETNYLNVDNTNRYRPILRFFYLQYEKMKYWLYQEDVYEELIEDPYFANYTLEQCQQDLSALVNWGNLVTIQDTKNVKTIEEFKNRKYQYQLSEYAVEIERMVIHLENLFVEGASLEPNLLERIRRELMQLNSMEEGSVERVYSWWQDLENDFVRLNQNYQDYMRTLNSVKAEEMMKTQQFLVFKDHLIEYLRAFVIALQQNVTLIEGAIKETKKDTIESILVKVVEYEMNIPRIDVEVDETAIREKMEGRWNSIVDWFVSRDGREAVVVKVFDTTNEIIRKITRYATRISEMSNMGANRREEYFKVAEMFGKCKDIYEAHRLSACVFGIEKTLHLKGDMQRETESINSGIYDEEPYVIEITPRTRVYREKTKRSGIIDKTAEKEEIRKETLERLERERRMLESYIQNNELDFSKLPEIEPHVRDTFLTWLSKALEREDETAKTDDGRVYHLAGDRTKNCIVKCTDGDFLMPAFTICFE